MSKRKEAIARYAIIINRLRRSPASYNQILQALELESEIHSYNYTVSKRAFGRALNDIRTIYGISIEFDFAGGKYHIVAEGEYENNQRLLEAFDTFNALKVTNRLPQFIHYETRRPSGTEHMSGLLRAIQNKLRVTFTYFKYWTGESALRHVEPLALKESINRWYLVARDLDKNAIRIFGLERLSSLEFTGEKFRRPKDFDVKRLFQYSFGIIVGTQKNPEDIVLAIQKPQAEYIKSMPLHVSQKILRETESEVHISLKLLITEDFVQEIMSHGDRIKVLQPQQLIEEIRNTCDEVLRQYKE